MIIIYTSSTFILPRRHKPPCRGGESLCLLWGRGATWGQHQSACMIMGNSLD